MPQATSKSTPAPLPELVARHHASPAAVTMDDSEERSQHDVALANGMTLQSLLLARRGPTLVVSFHGALKRTKYRIPRFERQRTFIDMGLPALFIADPALATDPRIALAWYLGDEELDIADDVVTVVRAAMAAVGATNVVFSGSSGGGFAALRISARMPGSVAVAFSPQTVIASYYKRVYEKMMRVCFPDRGPDPSVLGARTSLPELYREPIDNHVVYVQNVNDAAHLERHCQPWLDAVGLEAVHGSTSADGRRQLILQEGPARHAPPAHAQFRNGVRLGMRIAAGR